MEHFQKMPDYRTGESRELFTPRDGYSKDPSIKNTSENVFLYLSRKVKNYFSVIGKAYARFVDRSVEKELDSIGIEKIVDAFNPIPSIDLEVFDPQIKRPPRTVSPD
jgi:hypothetical protein